MNTLCDKFHWESMAEDVSTFCHQCLHCVPTRGGRMVPRPLGDTLVGARGNHVLQVDFLFVEPIKGQNHSQKYILVLKDDYTGYVWLIPCSEATSIVAAEGLLSWIASFGCPEILVSDGGSHFTAQLLDEVTRRTRVDHHIVTAYCHWSNGSVERANRTILDIMKSVLSESKSPTHAWPYLIPVVQSCINQTKTKRNAWTAPITAFIGRECQSPLDFILLPDHTLLKHDCVPVSMADHLQSLSQVFDRAADNISRGRDAQFRRNKQQSRGRHWNFMAGDYVLVAQPVQKSDQKLLFTWRGPFVVLETLNDHVVIVQDIVEPYKILKVHTRRLKFYADQSLHVTEELKEYRLLSEPEMVVDQLCDVRYDENSQRLEFLVKWLGLESLESTWEPAKILFEDVPVLVKSFVRSRGKKHVLWSKMQDLISTRSDQ